ncbi:MAG: chemotaxis protein CheW [Candidatus Pacebacteria bacterium]|nr:chemotaxis protein CheW [Candidatus Paceibacterota bacterium]
MVVTKTRNLSRQDGRDKAEQYVSIIIENQIFGVPVLQVHDVLGPQRITRIPLAPPEVAGSLNLRGRIVTAIDVRLRLGLPSRKEGETSMSVVVEHHNEFYSLMVDSVGEVLMLKESEFERSPATLEHRWREVSNGIYRLDTQLVVVLDVTRLLQFGRFEAA